MKLIEINFRMYLDDDDGGILLVILIIKEFPIIPLKVSL